MKKNHRIRISAFLAAALVVFTLAAPASGPLVQTASAVTQAEIDKLKKDAKDLSKKRQDIKAQLASLKNDKLNAIHRRELLDKDIAYTVEEISNKEAQIAGYDALLAQTELELEANKAEEAEKYELFCRRTRSMEENGAPSYWSALLGASSFKDLLSRLTDAQEIMEYDEQILEDLRTIRKEIEARKAEQEAIRQEAQEAKDALVAKKKELETKREEANQLVREMEEDVEANAAQLKELEAEENQIQRDIQKKSDELAEQMGWNATVGGYIWPVKSHRITSPYGQRNTGIHGASKNHKGVDIGGVGYDTNVVATKAGIVVTSKYSKSYGNYVVISHGKGNTTLYAHMSSRSVNEGDKVSQGQIVGVTGSTGISSGPHLHYEITENGSRVNPLNYLPGYIKAW